MAHSSVHSCRNPETMLVSMMTNFIIKVVREEKDGYAIRKKKEQCLGLVNDHSLEETKHHCC